MHLVSQQSTFRTLISTFSCPVWTQTTIPRTKISCNNLYTTRQRKGSTHLSIFISTTLLYLFMKHNPQFCYCKYSN